MKPRITQITRIYLKIKNEDLRFSWFLFRFFGGFVVRSF